MDDYPNALPEFELLPIELIKDAKSLKDITNESALLHLELAFMEWMEDNLLLNILTPFIPDKDEKYLNGSAMMVCFRMCAGLLNDEEFASGLSLLSAIYNCNTLKGLAEGWCKDD